MGFSADQSMTLISKAMMDALEGRRADINLEKMALMREQETLALEYNDAMSNTCFVEKDENGNYQPVGLKVDSSGKGTSTSGTLNAYDIQVDGATSAQMNNLNGKNKEASALEFNRMYNNGQIEFSNADGQKGIEGVAGISESYYTGDDAAAQAKYDAAMAKIRTKETKLDMDLEQVETQYQAIKTQYESARQLVNQRAQSDFKFFQG